ncbi:MULTISPECIES: hypothetical protein [unclassified Cryobacterium]|uniref:hypothetical protein n=1 Tax=unclassified Cryobacterium TaxID=2649013 RepID=UPI002AB3A549|nr:MULTISPECIES: hypothetical protein [unclassified Cryobacterium]MDY7544165.1 hypothetical protein [Cryobacterium sp. 5B3]MEA9997742.1 hypothetical protein [Cryobacterium sp. RTS3]MEB0266917.1 hypothetical protein [Cryobacterium sp. 10I5]MEB0276339.1 hypothetical protein [Cryobacterium sp. 5B3]
MSLICALTTALALAGCTQGSGGSSPGASPEPTASATPTSLPVALDCGLVLPVDRAATALGLPATSLFDPATQAAAEQQPNSGATRIVLQDAAAVLGGLVDCSWSAPDNGTGALTDDGSRMLPRVSVRVLRNAADEFTAGEPDSDDGLRGLHPVDLGDTAYVACHPPEHDSCRAEILVGTTWVNATVSPQPTEESFVTFARTVVAAVRTADAVPAAAVPRRVDCDTLLDSTDLANAVDMTHATSTDYGTSESGRMGTRGAAERLAGLVTCGWTSSDTSSGAGVSSGGVLVDVLPGARATWQATPPNEAKSSIRFEEATGLGDEAFAGCGGDTCEVDVLSGDVWVLVQQYAQPTGNLDGAKKLAVTALANYLANR